MIKTELVFEQLAREMEAFLMTCNSERDAVKSDRANNIWYRRVLSYEG